jgi:diadenosine tetraphosphatase ApaH/serine/threonine PP2A family protein phosphatase
MSGNSENGRVAIFSDIHGNLQALQAVLKAIDELDIKNVYCGGDVVGYGGNPNECCDLLRERNIPTVAGNHDHAALTLADISYFNRVAKEAVIWTQEQLTEDNTEWLHSLPMTINNKELDFLLVHASPYSPEEWNYVLTMGDARRAFEHFDERACFIGHSHQPFMIENFKGNLSCPTQSKIEMREDARFLVNVGSVGQPRDRVPFASFCILDNDGECIELSRTEYDIEGAQRAITDAGLPPELAERLAYGW